MNGFDECLDRPCGEEQACLDQDFLANGSYVCACIGESAEAVGALAECDTGQKIAPWLLTCILISAVMLCLSFTIVVQFAGKSFKDICSTDLRGEEDPTLAGDSVRMDSVNPQNVC